MTSEPKSQPTLLLSGTTASGKSAIAFELAKNLDLEIISADSVTVYRGLDVGSAKPSKQDLLEVPHHLINIREPNEPFTAGDFVRETECLLSDIHSRDKRAIIVGGTGFYLRALIYGLWEAAPTLQLAESLRSRWEGLSNSELHEELRTRDAVRASALHPNDRYRVLRALSICEQGPQLPSEIERRTTQNRKADPRFLLWIIDREKEELDRRILLRAQAMVRDGIIDETQKLIEQFPQSRVLETVGYHQTAEYLRKIAPPGRRISSGEVGLVEEIALATRQLCKKQRTWFRGRDLASMGREFILDRDYEKLWSEAVRFYASIQP